MSAELVGCDEIKAFFEDGWIDEALFPVGSGKEAGADAEPGTFAAELWSSTLGRVCSPRGVRPPSAAVTVANRSAPGRWQEDGHNRDAKRA